MDLKFIWQRYSMSIAFANLASEWKSSHILGLLSSVLTYFVIHSHSTWSATNVIQLFWNCRSFQLHILSSWWRLLVHVSPGGWFKSFAMAHISVQLALMISTCFACVAKALSNNIFLSLYETFSRIATARHVNANLLTIVCPTTTSC